MKLNNAKAVGCTSVAILLPNGPGKIRLCLTETGFLAKMFCCNHIVLSMRKGKAYFPLGL